MHLFHATHVCMLSYTHVYTRMHIRACMHCVGPYVHTRICMHARRPACVLSLVHMRVRRWLSITTRMCVCCACMHLHACTHMHLHVYTCICMHIACTCSQAWYACMRVCEHILAQYACMHVRMYVCIYACAHVCMCACVHTCMHACTRAYGSISLCMDVCTSACSTNECMRTCMCMHIYSLLCNLSFEQVMLVYNP